VESGYWTFRTDFSQADAIPGGPLLDGDGRILGVQTGMPEPGRFQFSKVSLRNSWWKQMKKGRIQGKWLEGSGPMIGIYTAVRRRGCGVAAVYPNTSAAAAGIKAGDVIVSIDGRATRGFEGIRRVLRDKDPGTEVNLVIRRGKQTIRKKLRLMPPGQYSRSNRK